jgi:hypothetical protein
LQGGGRHRQIVRLIIRVIYFKAKVTAAPASY